MTIHLYNEEELRSRSSAVVALLRREILALLPNVAVEEIGSTAIPGCLTKGDVDLLVHVNEDDFAGAVQTLASLYAFNEGMEGIEGFASFKGVKRDTDYGIQLTTPKANEFGFIEFRDMLRQSPKLVEEYNKIKLNAQHLTMVQYREKKNAFIEALLIQERALT